MQLQHCPFPESRTKQMRNLYPDPTRGLRSGSLTFINVTFVERCDALRCRQACTDKQWFRVSGMPIDRVFPRNWMG